MNNFSLRGIVFSALFAALVVVFGYVSINLGFTPVPITLQTLAVMLAGGLLGARYGFISLAMLVVLTAIGFPLLHGSGGMDTLLGGTGGYVIMWPFSALIIGWLMQKIQWKGLIGTIAAFVVMEVFGSLFLYVTGVPWLMHVYDMTLHKAMVAGCYPFLGGDAVKAAAAALIVSQIRLVFPPERLIGKPVQRVHEQLKSA